MGWTSNCDPLSNVGEATLEFETLEAAKAFCDKHGWQYEVRNTHRAVGANGYSTIPGGKDKNKKGPKSYGDNFSVQRKGIPQWPNPDGNYYTDNQLG